jgi:hypothetical protein
MMKQCVCGFPDYIVSYNGGRDGGHFTTYEAALAFKKKIEDRRFIDQIEKLRINV